MKDISNYIVSSVSADGLAPLGARPSADSEMTIFALYICGTGTWKGSEV